MPDFATITALGSFLLAGLAGSLHCVGMCGPILAGFSVAFRSQAVELTIDPALRSDKPRASIAWDMVAYHAGRIWTYALLGLLAGLAGNYLRHGSQWLGVQKAGGEVLSIAVIISGVVLLGVIPRFFKPKTACCESPEKTSEPSAPRKFIDALKQDRGMTPKLLLGAVMGLLPCGLVYAMLALAAALPNPFYSALGMAMFGLGTLPALTAVLLTANLIPARLRAHGTQLAGVVIIITGSWMLTRAMTITPENCCATEQPTAQVETR
jgi:sulfite exporter TauE/SafE